MASIVAPTAGAARVDRLSGTPRAHALDRWIFVIMALWFIAIALTGFIPDSLMKIEMVRAGQRPPFPLVLHMHAVLMGSFLLFLSAQTWLVATGRCAIHRRIGPIGAILAVALVIVGFVLVPTIYREVWGAAHFGPPPVRKAMSAFLPRLDNIALLQIRIGCLFPILLFLGLNARNGDSGFHKRMMIIAPATALPAAFDRITWLPTTFPDSPLAPDLYVLAAIAPMFLWDVIRNRRVHRAYWVFLAVAAPFIVVVHGVWDTAWWHATVPRIMGV